MKRLLIMCLLAIFIAISGCAKYKVVIRPDGTKELDVFSWRKFPKGAEIKYGSEGFLFDTDSVDAINPVDSAILRSLLGIPVLPVEDDGDD